jgi:hypothetical protein
MGAGWAGKMVMVCAQRAMWRVTGGRHATKMLDRITKICPFDSLLPCNTLEHSCTSEECSNPLPPPVDLPACVVLSRLPPGNHRAADIG